MPRRKFAKLKSLMFEKEVRQEDLCEALNHGITYISRRLNGKEPFTTSDIKIISAALEIPLTDCTQYFFEP